jgi:hypothetical protein
MNFTGRRLCQAYCLVRFQVLMAASRVGQYIPEDKSELPTVLFHYLKVINRGPIKWEM